MRNITKDNITDTVKQSFARIDDARLRYLIERLVHYVHGYAKETQLSHEEWQAALSFLLRSGEISSPSRSEFTLLSDVLGLSSLVDLLPASAGATDGSVLGPFHTPGSPWLESGSSLIRDNAGQPVLVRGRVTDTKGAPIANATVDFWQNADNGLYWQVDKTQSEDNLRCRMRVLADGSFEFLTIHPIPYMVPTDGPVGELLRVSHRDAWRPAHFHFIFEAPGYRTLVTEMFSDTDPYVNQDAVFGVRESLVCKFRSESDPAVQARYKLSGGYQVADFPVVLAPGK